MNYDHLIVSRVNVKWTDNYNNIVWLNKRVDLMNKTLRESIKYQTNKNFKFITLWGTEPIGKIDNEIQIVIESKGNGKILDEIKLKLKNYIDEDYVLTTRIDSDNCLSETYVENLHKNITDNKFPYYYDIKKMDIYNINNGNKRTWDSKKTSGFISVMEKVDDFKCIPYSYNHGKIGDIIDGVHIEDLNMLFVMHDDNMGVKTELGIFNDFDLNKYHINLKT